MDLFLNIDNFPDEDQTLRDKLRRLIMFLNHNEKYKDTNYIYIWFNIAHNCLINIFKINIEKYGL